MRGMNSDCVDLIYLDPPFNSNANYAAPIGSVAAGAHFKDTWTLKDVDVTWVELIDKKFPRIKHLLLACDSDSMKSYLIYMAIRLIEMKRILRESGSIYLHCDDTAGAHLKLLMDAIFGLKYCQSEITWKRTATQNGAKKSFGRVSDRILHYGSERSVFHPQHLDLTESYIKSVYKFDDKDNRGPYSSDNLAAPGNGGYHYEYKGYAPPSKGWRCPYSTMKKLDEENRLIFPKLKHRRIRRKRYLSESKGTLVNNLWTDFTALQHQSVEKCGYPTQKPLALMERIIKASSNQGEVVFDPFCGCATTLVAADRLRRRWVGIDVSEKAAELVLERIKLDQPKLLHEIHHRSDIPTRTDLGKLSHYTSHKEKLYGKQHGYCNGCDDHFEVRHLEVDHVIAKKYGGTDHIENLQLLCSHCNKVKGERGQEYLINYLQLNQKLLKQSRR